MMDTKLVIFLSPQVSLWLFKDNVDANGGGASSSRASGAGGECAGAIVPTGHPAWSSALRCPLAPPRVCGRHAALAPSVSLQGRIRSYPGFVHLPDDLKFYASSAWLLLSLPGQPMAGTFIDIPKCPLSICLCSYSFAGCNESAKRMELPGGAVG